MVKAARGPTSADIGVLPLKTSDLPRPVDGVRAVVNKRALREALGDQ
jgi:hypothetical protein